MSARREYEMFFRLSGGLDSNFTASFRNASTEMRGLQTAIGTVNTRLRDVSAYQAQVRAIERQNELINESNERLERLQERHRELAEQMQNETTNAAETLRNQFQRNNEQIRASERRLQGLQEQHRRLSEQLQNTTNPSEDLRNQLQRNEEQIRRSEQRLGRLQERHSALAEQMNNAAEPSERLRDELQRNEEQIQACCNSIGEQTRSLGEMNSALDESRTALQNAGINTDDLTGSTERLQQQLQRLSNTRGFLNNISQELSTAQADFKKSFGEFTALAGGVTAAVGTVYASASKPAIGFESAFAGVRKTVDATEEEFEDIRKVILEMSQSDVTASASEIAAVAEAAGQLGIKKENILDFSKVMIDLGESTNLSSTDAASSLAKFANITKMDPSDYQRLGSVIVGLGNNFATTEADIVSMATRIASTGELTGLSEAQIMGVATALSSVGIEAEAGGSSVSKLLKQFAVADANWRSNGDQNGKMAEFAKVAGMTTEAFSELYEQDSLKAISAFTKGLNDTERNGRSAIQILEDMDIKEVRLSNAVLALASSDDILTKAAETASTAWEENTALTEEAEKRYSTTESQIDMTKNAVENLGITVGDMTLPVIRDLAQGLNEAARGAQRWVKENPETIKQIASVAGEVAKYALLLKGTKVAYFGLKTGGLAAVKGVTKVKAAIQAAQAAGRGKGLSAFASSLTGLSASAAGFVTVGAATVAVLAAIAAGIYLNYKASMNARKEFMDSKLFNNGLPKLTDYTEALKESTEQHYKFAQEINESSEELSNIEYEMGKAKESVDLYNQILEENGTLTAEQAAAMYDPFNTLVGKLEEDFQVRFTMVFDAFKTSATMAAEELGVSVGEMSGVLESFKSRFTESTTESQQAINSLLDKRKNGEELTADDYQQFQNEMAYITDMADRKSTNLAAFEEQKSVLGGMDQGADAEASIANVEELLTYAKGYINEIDTAQKNLNREYDTFRGQAGTMLQYGKIDKAEYDETINALNIAQATTYEDYINKRNEFTGSLRETVLDLKEQISRTAADTVNENGINPWDLWIGTLGAGEQGYSIFDIAIGGIDSEAAHAGAAAAMGHAIKCTEELYSGITDKVNELNKTAGMPAIVIPVEISDTLEHLKSGALMTGPSLSDKSIIWGSTLPGHANGTAFTENAFIAGENGPELITGAPGRTVFTAEQTRTIFGVLPQALAVMTWGNRSGASVTINSNPVFNISDGEDAQTLFDRYNQNLAEKIAEVLDERRVNVRRNAYSY